MGFLTDRDHIRQRSPRGYDSFEMFKTFAANLHIKLCVQRAYNILSVIVQRLPRHSSRIVDIRGLSRDVVEFILENASLDMDDANHQVVPGACRNNANMQDIHNIVGRNRTTMDAKA